MKNARLLNRRELVAALIAGGSGLLASSPSVRSNSSGGGSDPDSSNELSSVEEREENLSLFIALSKIITARSTIDLEAAKKLHEVFIEEPDGEEHIKRTYLQLLDTMVGSHTSSQPSSSIITKLGETEQWFATHVLMTWYTGIYYHESRPTQRLLFRQALMFDALKNAYPVPYVGAKGFGQWSSLPPNSE